MTTRDGTTFGKSWTSFYANRCGPHHGMLDRLSHIAAATAAIWLRIPAANRNDCFSIGQYCSLKLLISDTRRLSF